MRDISAIYFFGLQEYLNKRRHSVIFPRRGSDTQVARFDEGQSAQEDRVSRSGGGQAIKKDFDNECLRKGRDPRLLLCERRQPKAHSLIVPRPRVSDLELTHRFAVLHMLLYKAKWCSKAESILHALDIIPIRD